MPRNCSAAICLLLALCIATPCLGTVSAQERRIRCGEYSYILPEGFTAFDMPQPSNTDNVYLNMWDDTVGHRSDSGVTCIIKTTSENKEDLLESVRTIEESPRLKNATLYVLVKFDKEIKHGVRVYHEKLYNEFQTLNWSRFWIDLNPKNSKKHTILYFWCTNNYKKTKNYKQKNSIILTKDEIKQRAFNFILSIKYDN